MTTSSFSQDLFCSIWFCVRLNAVSLEIERVIRTSKIRIFHNFLCCIFCRYRKQQLLKWKKESAVVCMCGLFATVLNIKLYFWYSSKPRHRNLISTNTRRIATCSNTYVAYRMKMKDNNKNEDDNNAHNIHNGYAIEIWIHCNLKRMECMAK